MNASRQSIYQLLSQYLHQEAANENLDDLCITRLPPTPGSPTSIHYSPAPAATAAAALNDSTQEPYTLDISDTDSPAQFVIPDGSKQSQLDALRAFIGQCPQCPVLVRNRRSVVFGSGNPDADIMFVGEAPGNDEDIQGIPFVGRAGQLLMNIIEKGMKMSRDDVYIANILKCRPPNNRNPQADEVRNCTPFLHLQLDIIKPRVIIALGLFAAQFLTGKEIGIGKLRGQFHFYRDIPVMPTYHPAYLLRNYSRESRQKVWDDIQLVMQYLRENPGKNA